MKSKSQQPGCAKPSRTILDPRTALFPRLSGNGQAEAEKRRNEELREAQQAAMEAQREQARERKQQEEAQRAKARVAYGTTDEQEAQWAQVMLALKIKNIDAIYGMLAQTQVLTVEDNDLLIGVPSTFHHQQLTTLHPRNLTVIKREIKLFFHADLNPRFVVVEPVA